MRSDLASVWRQAGVQGCGGQSPAGGFIARCIVGLRRAFGCSFILINEGLSEAQLHWHNPAGGTRLVNTYPGRGSESRIKSKVSHHFTSSHKALAVHHVISHPLIWRSPSIMYILSYCARLLSTILHRSRHLHLISCGARPLLSIPYNFRSISRVVGRIGPYKGGGERRVNLRVCHPLS